MKTWTLALGMILMSLYLFTAVVKCVSSFMPWFHFCIEIPDLVPPVISQYVPYIHHTRLVYVGDYIVLGTFVEDFW